MIEPFNDIRFKMHQLQPSLLTILAVRGFGPFRGVFRKKYLWCISSISFLLTVREPGIWMGRHATGICGRSSEHCSRRTRDQGERDPEEKSVHEESSV